MPKKIIIVRHGETQYNVDRRMQGWTNIPLNKTGKEQAKKLADRLKSETITAIYTSDQRRAYLTASYIAKSLSLTPKKRKNIREIKMGIFEGWQWDSTENPTMAKLWQDRELALKRGDIYWDAEGTESTKSLRDRVNKFIDNIERKHQNDSIVIVSHGATLNRLLEGYGVKSTNDEYIAFDNTSVTILTNQDGKYHIEIFNDTSHL